MAKRFSRRVTRKTQYKLTPKDAETIIRQEFTDSKGNKYYTDTNIRPHNPQKGTVEGYVNHKGDK